MVNMEKVWSVSNTKSKSVCVCVCSKDYNDGWSCRDVHVCSVMLCVMFIPCFFSTSVFTVQIIDQM